MPYLNFTLDNLTCTRDCISILFFINRNLIPPLSMKLGKQYVLLG